MATGITALLQQIFCIPIREFFLDRWIELSNKGSSIIDQFLTYFYIQGPYGDSTAVRAPQELIWMCFYQDFPCRKVLRKQWPVII